MGGLDAAICPAVAHIALNVMAGPVPANRRGTIGRGQCRY